MTERDFVDRLQASRDAVRRLQRSLVRYAMPAEQREALIDGVRRILVPGEQLSVVTDMIDAFGPAMAQIEGLREEIASQREQLRRMDERLIQMEAAAERLALAAEQIRLFQEPFVRLASLVTGQQVERSGQHESETSVDFDDDPADADSETDS